MKDRSKTFEGRPVRRRSDRLVRFCALACTITLACALPTPRVHPRTLSRVGLLPVEVTHTTTFYEAGFKEGFATLYLDPAKMGTSNTAGDIILLAIWLLSIPVGIVGGVVEERRGPSDEEIERIRAVADPVLPEFDLAGIVRRETTAELLGMLEATPDELIERARHPVDRVLQVSSLEDALDEDLTMLLEVRIERIILNSPWEENPSGQIVLETVVRLLDPQTGEEKNRHTLSNPGAGPPLDWSLLESGEVGLFAQHLTEALDAAGTSLAAEIVEVVWTFKPR